MKNLILYFILFYFPSFAYGYPTFQDKSSPCVLSYYEFCQGQKTKIANMCPQEVTEKMKEQCLINDFAKTVILKRCESEVKEVCEKEKSFKDQYLCLTNPRNWSKMEMKCLQSLSRGFHEPQGEGKL